MSSPTSFSSLLVATATNLSLPSASSSLPSSAAASYQYADAASASFLSAATAAPAAAPFSALGPLHVDQSQGECELLGPFALIVQAALGALALLSLVYKRWRERPQRPVRVWFFDASKQVFGSVLVHMSNIFMSMLTSGRFSINAVIQERGEDPYVPNPCSFYLLNLAIDTTLGIPILIILIRVFTALVSFTPLGKPLESIQSGYYGTPPKSWWWLKQSFIYFSSLFGMKICVLIIFLMMPWISRVGDWALQWTEGDEKLQVAFVMMIFPLIMNAIQYYIIDSFIKKPVHVHHRHHQLANPDSPSDSFDGSRHRRRHRRRHRFSALDDDEDDEDDLGLVHGLDDDDDQDISDGELHSDSDDDATRRIKDAQKRRGPARTRADDQHHLDDGYDPDADTRSTASAAASSSSSRTPAQQDIADLLPKE